MENLNIEAILTAGAAAAAVKDINGVPFVVLPEGYRAQNVAESVNAVNERNAPIRQTGTRTLLDAASFIRFIAPLVGTKEAPAVDLYYHVEPSPVFTVILNPARPFLPSHEDYRAVYAAPLSKEWLQWAAYDKKQMGQVAFAQFIERNLLDIANPSGAEMIELTTNFQANKGVKFASGTRLQNGQTQLVYEETIAAKAGERGQLEIPEEITLRLPVFEGSTVADELTAKFRYKIDGGDLQMWYELIRPHKVLEVATADLLKQIETATNLVGFKGTL